MGTIIEELSNENKKLLNEIENIKHKLEIETLSLELSIFKEDNKISIDKKDTIIEGLSNENKKLLNEIENIKNEYNSCFSKTENNQNENNEKSNKHKLEIETLSLELSNLKEDNKISIDKKDTIIEELSSENKKLLNEIENIKNEYNF